ncbi:hypothetical protein I3F58_07105 [Streptomyces sp. MUM 203J]|uniref:hypothetical protein n=1 Tax=Streptomyces sp. MUM 203J TaxID=2791990 RepID=UPI001F049224|nr:hypothetical protein [Streptomyces sp. MUM 203J]MCH0539332.1 hypothetical protein [Streptomyces sp. MUM 203J]
MSGCRYDLKGNPQPDIYAANTPRLAATLGDLSEALGTEIDPDDPSYFGKPTDTGIENYFDSDRRASDVWATFEIPRRYSEFRHAPGFGDIGFKRSAMGPVEYVAVLDELGTLGYLWASDTENAASFEPCDVDDDNRYAAARWWLERIRLAHDRGLTPSQALSELASASEDDVVSVLGLSELGKVSGSERQDQ